MFVDPVFRPTDPIGGIIAELNGGVRDTLHPRIGIFEIGHFSFDCQLSRDGGNLREDDDWIDGFLNWKIPSALPENLPFYGVCDSIDQFLSDFGPVLEDDAGSYCVSFTHVAKTPEPGGWRWHKWGPYLGKGKPTAEYLADEAGFADGVYCFHIYKQRPR